MPRINVRGFKGELIIFKTIHPLLNTHQLICCDSLFHRLYSYHMKYILIITTLFLLTSCHYNIGHRLGGDVTSRYPENTVESLSELIKHRRTDYNFRYIEFDVQEVSDTNLYVFHDRTINRVIPVEKFGNEQVLQPLSEDSNRIEFSSLSEIEIQQINLSADSIKVPTMEQVLITIKKLNFKGKSYIEIKRFTTDKGRNDFITLIEKYSKGLNLTVIASEKNFKYSFPDQVKWCREFNKRGIPVLKVGWHCKICKPKN
jgi:glycerophosphoryl diester phosphodiesterase